MEYIELETTKYVRETIENEVRQTRKAQRKQAGRSIFMFTICFAVFVGTFLLVTNNLDSVSAVVNRL